MKKPASRLALAASMALVAAGCGPGGDAGGGRAGGERTVVVAYPVDIQGVNEVIAQSTVIMNALIYHAMFVQLVEEQADYEKGPPSFEPRLAESYEFSADRLQLTFRLRDDLVWSDGAPITAEDVRWTWQAQTHPAIAWGFAEAKERITDVEVVDPRTVAFHFSEAYAAQLQDANFGVILPQHAWSELPFEQWRKSSSWFVDHLVVSGPFTLESWTPQQRYILRRNERYYEEGLPKVDRVVFQVTPEDNSRVAMLRSRQANMVEYIDPSDAATIIADLGLELLSHIPRNFSFVQWNVSRPLFASKTVRQALTMGIDRQEIVDSLLYGYGRVSHTLFPSNLWAHHSGIEPWPYDPGQAKELLASEGWTDTDGDGILDREGQPFSFELLTNVESQIRVDLLVMVQEHLKRIGVDVRTRAMEFHSLLAPLGKHDFDAVFQTLGIDTSLNTTYFFHSDGIEGAYNWGAYSNPEMDRLIEATVAEIDQLAAKPLYLELQELLHEELPMTFIYESRRLSGVTRNLRDVNPNQLNSFFNLRRWRLVDE